MHMTLDLRSDISELERLIADDARYKALAEIGGKSGDGKDVDVAMDESEYRQAIIAERHGLSILGIELLQALRKNQAVTVQ